MSKQLSRAIGWVVVAAVGAFALVSLWQSSRPETGYSAFRGWYADTAKGPAIVVELWSFRGPIPSHEPRYSQDAEQKVRYYSYQLSNDALLGSFERAGWNVLDAWRGRLWACDAKATPLLLSADGLAVVAEHSAIQNAIGGMVGGDFEVSGSPCYVYPYSGQLAIKGADGKAYRVTTEPRALPHPSSAVYPPGWQCSINSQGSTLVEARLALCLSPEAAPVTSLLLSRPSALQKHAGRPELLSAIAADPIAPSKLLWSRSLTEFTASPDAPFLIGQHQLDAHRAALLLRTAGPIIHVVVIELSSGKVVESKALKALAELTKQLATRD